MIIIDHNDRRPIYEQIVERFEQLIGCGALEADSPMPSVRSLAMELSLNPNTVQRAYQELERRGAIYTVKGKGSFVNVKSASRASKDETQEALKLHNVQSLDEERKQDMEQEVKQGLSRALLAGTSAEELKKWVDECAAENVKKQAIRQEMQEGVSKALLAGISTDELKDMLARYVDEANESAKGKGESV